MEDAAFIASAPPADNCRTYDMDGRGNSFRRRE